MAIEIAGLVFLGGPNIGSGRRVVTIHGYNTTEPPAAPCLALAMLRTWRTGALLQSIDAHGNPRVGPAPLDHVDPN